MMEFWWNEKLCFGENKDKEIEENVNQCRGCEIATKAPQVKFTPFAKDWQTLVEVAYRFCCSNEGTISFISDWQFLKMAKGDEV